MKKVLLITFLTISLSGFTQTDKELAEQTVNQNLIKSHIGFLASDELRGRDTGSPELKIAARYIKSRFVEYGVSVVEGMQNYEQPVPMKMISPASAGIVRLGEAEFNFGDDFILMDGDQSSLEGRVVFVGYGTEEELEKKKLEGAIVVSLCGDGTSENPQAWFSQSAKKGQRLKELGAVGLIELYNSVQIPWNFLTRYFNRDQTLLDEGGEAFTRIWLNRTSDSISGLDSKKTTGTINIELGTTNRFMSQNIVGVVEGTDPQLKNEYVVYSAHYDHIGVGLADAEGDSIYNGSRDNAVGTVTVLAAAQNLGKNPTKRSSLFVLFTGEEKGLLGSKSFIDNSPVALDKVVYCFNSDNGGYNDTSKATIIGLTRTTAEEMIIEACKAFGLEAIEDPAPEQGLFDRSDNVRFAAKGIPAPTFSMGFTAFDAEITKYYHQAGDDPNTLDYAYLEKFFRSYVYACRMIGNAKKAPFWVKGDKYYENGKNLYK